MELCLSHSWLQRTTHYTPPKSKLSLPSVPAGKVKPGVHLISSISNCLLWLVSIANYFEKKVVTLSKRIIVACTTLDSNIYSIANLSLLSLPAFFFTDNSGHDNDTESVSELTSGCSSPLMFKCVHVSTVSHHSNYTFIPFLIEWFLQTGCRFFFHAWWKTEILMLLASILYLFYFSFWYFLTAALLFSGEADKNE